MSDSVIAPSPSEVIAAGIVWPVLGALVVALRFYTRRVQGASLLKDDWLTIPALVLTFGLGAILVFGVCKRAFGYPTPAPANPEDALNRNSPEAMLNQELVWIFQLVQIPALACVKLSFVFFYRRIFCTGIGNVFRNITTVVIAIILVWAVAFELTFLLICKGHFSAWWMSSKALEAYCRPELKMELGFSSTDFITDVIVILLPLPSILGLQMSPRRKLAVIMIFCLGALTVAASITRMVIFVQAVQSLKKDFTTSGANNLLTTAGLYWSMFESGIGLISACLPTIYSLSRRRVYGDHYELPDKPRIDSMSSDTRIVAGLNGPASIETHALRELDPVFPNFEPPDGQIIVNKSFQTMDNKV